MDADTAAALRRVAATLAEHEARLHATRLVVAQALAMLPIDIEELRLRVMGQRHQAAMRPDRVATPEHQAAVAAAVEMLLDAAAGLQPGSSAP